MRGRIKWVAVLAVLLVMVAFLGLRDYYSTAPEVTETSTADAQAQQAAQTQTTGRIYVEQAGESLATTATPGGRKGNATLTLYIEDDAGPLDGLVFILPAAPEDDSLPDRLEPVAVVRGRAEAPSHVEKLLEKWNADKYPKVGITVVVLNGTDIATAPAEVDLKAYKKAKERGEKYEIKAKVRGKVKRDRGDRGTHFAACPEAVMVKEDEYQTDFMPTPLFRVRNLAGVYGMFQIGLAVNYEKRFSFGLAVQEDIKDLINVGFKIEGLSYALDAKYWGNKLTGIPPSGGKMINIWTKGKYEVYRIDYYAGDVRGCLIIDQDWLYRVYPTAVQTSGNEIIMGDAYMTDADIQIPGTTSIFYKRYTGTGSPNDSPIYEIQVPHLAGWFYQECPGMLDRVEVGAGVDLGKLIVRKAAQAGKVVAERFAKVIELVGVDVAWTSGTNFFVVLGGLRFDAPSGKQFDLYFYTTQHKVEIPGCGQVDLPFLYAEFR